MNANVRGSEWVDPDDAPELDDEFFAKATRKVGGKEVTEAEFDAAKKRMGRPPLETRKVSLNMRVDPDILEALKATGQGWQTRVNDLLRRGGRCHSRSSISKLYYLTVSSPDGV
jgi:uncharacterized protein (DUF4415 family)